ncbi:MAG: hypothetical protein AAGI52_15330 [Bacteroidota bacterium]
MNDSRPDPDEFPATGASVPGTPLDDEPISRAPDPAEPSQPSAEADPAAEGAPPTIAPVSAIDRLQTPHEESEPDGVSWAWLAGVVLVVMGIVGVWIWTHRDTGPDNDLLREAVAAYEEFRTAEITNDPEVAATWVLENLREVFLFPPEIEGYELLGVGSADFAEGVSVPAFRYDGRNGSTFVVFGYDYYLLDRAAESGRLRLAPEVYARLAEPEPVDIRREGDSYVVTWRRRSLLFTAVAPGEELAERISNAVRREEL